MLAVQDYMARAVEIAAAVPPHQTRPNPRVGCVLVREGKIVGEGAHQQCGGPHAEVVALAAVQESAGTTAYITLEPCCHQGRTGPCTAVLIEAGVSQVVVAMLDPNPRVAGQGVALLEQAGIRCEVGLLADAAVELNRGFLQRMQSGRPWVRVKAAMSMDGRSALASGESRWITSADSRREVHQLRAEADLILTGVGTVLADDPALTVRDVATTATPDRLVLDSHLRSSPEAQMLRQPGQTTIVCLDETSPEATALKSAGARVVALPAQQGRISLPALMQWLGAEEVNELLVEAGETLTGALLEQGLVDELLLYVAPSLLGSTGRGIAALPGVNALSQRIELVVLDVQQVGADWRVRLRPVPPAGEKH